jgi:hypothetical protein
MPFPGFAMHRAKISQGRAAYPFATTVKTAPSEKKLKPCGDLARIVVTGIGVHTLGVHALIERLKAPPAQISGSCQGAV